MQGFVRGGLTAAIFLVVGATSFGQEQKEIRLPHPRMEGGRPLMEVLKDRQTSRSFSNRELPQQVLSDLLWAGFGINRPSVGKRTAPSASNKQAIDIYVALVDGLYLYDASRHALRQILSEDVRALTGKQSWAGDAPVSLVYVADSSKMEPRSEGSKVLCSAADTGFIGQNVHLFCASEGLAAAVRDAIDRPALAEKMGLRKDQRITLAQSVGYPGQ